MTKKFFLVGSNASVRNLFIDYGWEQSLSVAKADLVVFLGGEDVNPILYNARGCHPSTHFSTKRDDLDLRFHASALLHKKPMVGICRGAQFLNVMCGGSLWQDVNNHSLAGTHDCIDVSDGSVFQATSTHHQMMNPAKDAYIICEAYESTRKDSVKTNNRSIQVMVPKTEADPEVVIYWQKDITVLCFQPHPEYGNATKECKDKFFEYIDTYLIGKPSSPETKAKVA